mmetsp:Transcript_19578/g.50204  ORF Transcript_19578/g.50204 Transcript_19578/m.50204 type:complete len:156 (+) Transcript_19578:399-866(+)
MSKFEEWFTYEDCCTESGDMWECSPDSEYHVNVPLGSPSPNSEGTLINLFPSDTYCGPPSVDGLLEPAEGVGASVATSALPTTRRCMAPRRGSEPALLRGGDKVTGTNTFAQQGSPSTMVIDRRPFEPYLDLRLWFQGSFELSSLRLVIAHEALR